MGSDEWDALAKEIEDSGVDANTLQGRWLFEDELNRRNAADAETTAGPAGEPTAGASQ